jgi:CRP-like cAMP-binding protein
VEEEMLDKGLLDGFSIFSEVPQDKLSGIAEKCDLLEFKSDEVIFQQGETAKNLYGVLDGEVELSLVFQDRVLKTDIDYEESITARFEVMEKPIVVDTLGPGEVFGWSALVSPRQLTATARCSKHTRVFTLSADDLKAMNDQDPSVGYLIMEKLAEVIAQRLQARTDKLIETWGEAFEVDKV